MELRKKKSANIEPNFANIAKAMEMQRKASPETFKGSVYEQIYREALQQLSKKI
jgi:cytoplasmic iron level regulating protein YaaA (DUF328/UPF0246 family)|tara:strand:+ start:124 stop:285 length:162 start_codon:yes stop_codon:yes gene_type:complete